MRAETSGTAPAESAGEGDLEVHGPGLSLRYARPEDAPRLFELASDPAVTRYFSWGPYTRERQAIDYITSLARKRAGGERIEFVIDHHEAGVIGVTGLSEFAVRDRRAGGGPLQWQEGGGRGGERPPERTGRAPGIVRSGGEEG